MTLKYASKSKIILYFLLSFIYATGNVAIAYITKIMLNYAQFHTGTLKDLVEVALYGSLIIIIIMVSNILYKYLKNDIVKDINLHLKSKIMTYLLFKNVGCQKDGLSLMTNDLKQIETLRINNELLIISEFFSFFLSVIVGLINSWLLTIIFIATTLLPGLIQKIFTKSLQKKSEAWESSNANYTQSVSDGLNGTMTINLYNAQFPVLKHIFSSAKKMEISLQSLNYTQDVANQIIIAIANIFSFILPFLIGAILMFNGQIGAGTLIMIVQLSNNFINPVVNIFNQLNQIKSTKPIWNKLEKGLSYTPHHDNGLHDESFNNLELNDITYKIQNRILFSDLNINIKSGQKILINAPSGWGKSTLLKIIVGNLSPTKGRILINDKDFTGNWGKAHNYFSYVTQSPFMFDDTLEFNITFGNKYSNTELSKAIKKAGLEDLVKEKGLNYKIGEKGQNLSGGQIQRIEIARALLSNRPIMLADEATSALDSKLSKQIHEIIVSDKNLTVFEVAHKISDEEKVKFDRMIALDKM